MSGRGGRPYARRARTQPNEPLVPDGPIYYEMLRDVGALPSAAATASTGTGRPLKRRRTMQPQAPIARESNVSEKVLQISEAAATLGTVATLAPAESPNTQSSTATRKRSGISGRLSPEKTFVETANVELESTLTVLVEDEASEESNTDESDEDFDIAWEDVDLGSHAPRFSFTAVQEKNDEPLNLILNDKDKSRPPVSRRQITKADRRMRLEAHKLGLLCWVSHVYHRNRWCNSLEVHKNLRTLLDEETLSALNEDETHHQFRRDRQFIKGLERAAQCWAQMFKITRRGLHQFPWCDLESLKSVASINDPTFDPPITKTTFIQFSEALSGSRDLGAQLFCALLRSIGIETRIVCSLQPIPFSFSSPSRPSKPVYYLQTEPNAVSENCTQAGDSSTSAPLKLRSRGSLRNPTLYSPALPCTPSSEPVLPEESSLPIYWVEAWNVASQRWIPVDPLVTHTVGKPSQLCPTPSDPLNIMSYVVAFEADGEAKDITRRYSKFFNAKTRKLRVTCIKGGQEWWDGVLGNFTRGWKLDRDQLEEQELANRELKEGIPNSISDLKDHPHFALKRHLKRNEIIFPERKVGSVKIGVGDKATTEDVFRRQDVKVVRSPMQWYRLGREIKSGQQAVKYVVKSFHAAAKSSHHDIDLLDDEDQSNEGNNRGLYLESQTELYTPPPVINGRVPKNSFGNLDIYAPSMIPAGAIHVPHRLALQAVKLLGIDYAEAVTGFEFKGGGRVRGRGTTASAVINGVVIANEYKDAMMVTLQCMVQGEQEEWENKKARESLRMWKRFLVALRVRERLNAEYGEIETLGAEREMMLQPSPPRTSPPTLHRTPMDKKVAKGKEKARDDLDNFDLTVQSAYNKINREMQNPVVAGGGDEGSRFPSQQYKITTTLGFIPEEMVGASGYFQPPGHSTDSGGGGFTAEDSISEGEALIPECGNCDGGGFINEDEGAEGNDGFIVEKPAMLSGEQRNVENTKEGKEIGQEQTRQEDDDKGSLFSEDPDDWDNEDMDWL